MLDDIVQLRLHGDKLDTMTFDKPSTLPHNIATVDKPPKEQVIAAHISRFRTKHTAFDTNILLINTNFS